MIWLPIVIWSNQFLYPWTRDDVWSVLFSCVEFNGCLALHVLLDLLVDFFKSLCRKISCKIHSGSLVCTLLVWNVLVPSVPGTFFCIACFTHSFTSCQFTYSLLINNFIMDPEVRLRSISFCKKVNFGVLSPSELCFPVLRLLLVSGYVRPFLHSDICGHFPRKPVLSWRKLESFLHLRGPARGLP